MFNDGSPSKFADYPNIMVWISTLTSNANVNSMDQSIKDLRESCVCEHGDIEKKILNCFDHVLLASEKIGSKDVCGLSRQKPIEMLIYNFFDDQTNNIVHSWVKHLLSEFFPGPLIGFTSFRELILRCIAMRKILFAIRHSIFIIQNQGFELSLKNFLVNCSAPQSFNQQDPCTVRPFFVLHKIIPLFADALIDSIVKHSHSPKVVTDHQLDIVMTADELHSVVLGIWISTNEHRHILS